MGFLSTPGQAARVANIDDELQIGQVEMIGHSVDWA